MGVEPIKKNPLTVGSIYMNLEKKRR